MSSSAPANFRVGLSCCQVQIGHPHVRGNGAAVGGPDRLLAFSVVSEKKKRVTVSPAGLMWGLRSWDLARLSLYSFMSKPNTDW